MVDGINDEPKFIFTDYTCEAVSNLFKASEKKMEENWQKYLSKVFKGQYQLSLNKFLRDQNLSK